MAAGLWRIELEIQDYLFGMPRTGVRGVSWRNTHDTRRKFPKYRPKIRATATEHSVFAVTNHAQHERHIHVCDLGLN